MAEVTKINFKGTVLDIRDTGAARASDLAAKQDVLVSGTNIKTINGESIVGTGDIEVGSGDVATAFTITITSTTIEVQPMTGAMMTVGTDVSFQVV